MWQRHLPRDSIPIDVENVNKALAVILREDEGMSLCTRQRWDEGTAAGHPWNPKRMGINKYH